MFVWRRLKMSEKEAGESQFLKDWPLGWLDLDFCFRWRLRMGWPLLNSESGSDPPPIIYSLQQKIKILIEHTFLHQKGNFYREI